MLLLLIVSKNRKKLDICSFPIDSAEDVWFSIEVIFPWNNKTLPTRYANINVFYLEAVLYQINSKK